MFESARLKIERVDKHIADLRAACDEFTGHRQNFGFHKDAQSDSMVVDVRLSKPLPSDWPLIIGDAVHNLRTALDHATWELIGFDGGQQDRWLSFPTGRFQRDYEASCGRIKTPRADTRKFFITLEAYVGGVGEKLFGLGLLNNLDKHQFLTLIVGISTIESAKIMKGTQVIVTLDNCAFTMGPDGKAHLAKVPPGLSFEFDEKAGPTVDVFFGKVEIFKNKPLVPMLTSLSEFVDDTIWKFEEFVKSRP